MQLKLKNLFHLNIVKDYFKMKAFLYFFLITSNFSQSQSKINYEINIVSLKDSIQCMNLNEKYVFEIPPLDLTKVKKRLDEYISGEKPKMTYYTNAQIKLFREQLANKKMTTEKFNLIVNDHNMLLELRNKYFHWSAKFGEVGLGPNYEFTDKFNIRRFRNKAKDS